MQIRQATIDDSYRILDLYRELRNHIETVQEKPLSEWSDGEDESQQRRLEEFLLEANHAILTIGNNYEIVGFASVIVQSIVRQDQDYLFVEDFFVSENFRAQGFGKKLFASIKDFAKTKNIKVIKLSSYLELTQAHQFYEKMGGKFVQKTYQFEI